MPGSPGSHGLGMSQEPWEPANAALPLLTRWPFGEPLHLSSSHPPFFFLVLFHRVAQFVGTVVDLPFESFLSLE